MLKLPPTETTTGRITGVSAPCRIRGVSRWGNTWALTLAAEKLGQFDGKYLKQTLTFGSEAEALGAFVGLSDLLKHNEVWIRPREESPWLTSLNG